MKVHNLGKEIDNLHKNVVNVESKRGIKTSASDDIDSATNSNLTDADVEEQQKHRIKQF